MGTHDDRTASDSASTPETSELLPIVYEDLRRMAAAFFQRESPDQTLQPTALVHEVYLRLADQKVDGWSGRSHFLALAARTMRRVLVDAGRARKADRRGGQLHRVTLGDPANSGETLAVEVTDLGDALERLGEIRPRSLEIVELRFFAGLSFEETAETLGVSKSAIAKEWRLGRAYLSKFLGETPDTETPGQE